VDGDPARSPDGSRIAFARSDASSVMNRNGSSARRLTTGASFIAGVSWSPDGRTIAVGTNNGDEGWDRTDRSRGRRLVGSSKNATDPAWQSLPR